jgi:inhibitor of the pro-sigma K processing machinery
MINFGILPWILTALVVVAALILLRRPLGWLAALAAGNALGLGALFMFSQVGGLIGVTLGVNLWNALVLGLLGIPGFGLLLMLSWTLVR